MNTKEMIRKLEEYQEYGYVTLLKEEAAAIIKTLKEYSMIRAIINDPHTTQDQTMKELLSFIQNH